MSASVENDASLTAESNAPPMQMVELARIAYRLPNPEKATESAWKAYIQNREGAKKFPGFEFQERETNWEDVAFVIEGIRDVIAKLEKEMGLKNKLLQRSFKMLGCVATFGENERPTEAVTHTRLFSPTRPAYIDVHITYRHETGWNSCAWSYTIGVKIYTSPGKADYKPPILKRFEYMNPDKAYGIDGWRRLAYGFYEDSRAYEMMENKAFGLNHKDILEIYEAFWGPLEDLPENADEVAKVARRRKLVDCIRLLLAAVGIEYHIAVTDTEVDDSLVDSGRIWTLEGIQTDLWFARETRRACGFKLADDPKKEGKAKKNRFEDARRNMIMARDEYDEDDEDGEEEEEDFESDED